MVPEYSATLGFAGELRIALDGDHSTIVKYASERDNNFRQVSRNVAALVRDARVRDKLSKEPVQTENKFLVPYQANPRFIGRANFLQTLKEELSAVTPGQHNHRIALYGMGGIGKHNVPCDMSMPIPMHTIEYIGLPQSIKPLY